MGVHGIACCMLAVCCLTALPRAHAQERAGSTNDAEVTAELARIEAVFRREAPFARLWWCGWLSYAVAEGTVGAVAYTHAHGQLNRDLWLVTSVGSAAFVLELAAFPLVSVYASGRLARLPRSTPEARVQARSEARRLLDRSARLEEEGTSVLSHLLGAAWALGSAGYLLGRNLRFHEGAGSPHNRVVWRNTMIDLAWTVAVTELAIWTQPRASMRAAERMLSSRGPRLFFGASLGGISFRMIY